MFRNEKGEIRSGWIIAASIVIIFTVIQVLSMPVMQIAQTILVKNKDFNTETLEFTARGLESMKYVSAALMLVQELCFLAVPLFIWKYFLRRPVREIGLKPVSKHMPELLTGLGLGIVSMSLIFGILVLTGNAAVDKGKVNFSIDLLLGLIVYLSVGFAEELFNRGFIMSLLRQTKNKIAIFLVPSAIFAVMHAGNSNVSPFAYVNLFLIGLFFSYLYVKSGNIWMCIGFHITWNYFQGNIFGFLVSGQGNNGLFTTRFLSNNLINGGEFGPEGGLAATLVIILCFLYAGFFYRNKDYDFFSEGMDVMQATAAREQVTAKAPVKKEKSIRDITSSVSLKTIENYKEAAEGRSPSKQDKTDTTQPLPDSSEPADSLTDQPK